MKARRDEGFTLLEVLIAMGLMGLIFTVVAAAFVVSVGGSRDSTHVLQESQAGSLTSAYFNKDLQSADSVSDSTPRCGSDPGALVVSLQWTDLASTEGVDYVLEDAADGTKSLVRNRCGSATASDTVAQRLASATLTCTPSCSGATSARLDLTGELGSSYTISSDRRLP